MVRQVDAALRTLLEDVYPRVSFRTPTPEWEAALDDVTINAFLYDMRERQDLRQAGTISLYDNGGGNYTTVPSPSNLPKVYQFGAIRYAALSYLVTLWGVEDDMGMPETLHEKLVEVYTALILSTSFQLQDPEPEEGISLFPYACEYARLVVSAPSPDGRILPEIWQALKLPPKPVVHVSVSIPIVGTRPEELPQLGTPVTAVDVETTLPTPTP
ncbi:Pvc16 family protein [Streptomyces goshikiensis]|uniref:Pvc16 family protein n=1 Tax=Streptomyces goshikiensis TaxID=1942 RepID=UPI0036889DA1